jgi:uncharacterized membrane protein
MDGKKQRALLAASVAGLVAAAGLMAGGRPVQADEGEQVPCYGINKCKGTGDCGGKGHSCAGQNECAGHGYITLDKDTCLKINGGRLTPDAE